MLLGRTGKVKDLPQSMDRKEKPRENIAFLEPNFEEANGEHSKL